MNEFKKSEEWNMPICHNGKQVATVQIRHWTREGYSSPTYGTIPDRNCWNVYALVWPEHPKFQDLLTNYMDNGTVYSMPLHGGCTFQEISYSQQGNPVRVKVGCDYAHYGDDRFEEYADLEQAYEVKCDALELALWLTQHA